LHAGEAGAMSDVLNRQIAGRLEEAARLLHEQGADRFRVNAYLRAATSVRQRPEPMDHVFRERGLDGLEEIPGVGPTIARAIRELLASGRLPMLERLRGASDPEAVLASVPGIGRRLAERLHEELALNTL
jgi:DNA polymerase (family X)